MNLRGGLLRTTLHLEQRYTFAEDPAASARERWRVEIAAYRYTLSEQETKRELFAFHWHPGEEQIAMPHVHPGSRILSEQALAGRHVPTGPIAVPDLLRFLIAELGVRPERADWQRVIARIGEFYGAWQVAGTCEAS
ncbi:MAG TPA: hypothetical protein VKV26_25195 [Dehalococcoidia bacterium]|nr:hypothetical protein [Dehalococcoidia bacterium]